MHDKPSGAHDGRATTTGDQDDRDQAAVLREVLFIYSEVLTLDELTGRYASCAAAIRSPWSTICSEPKVEPLPRP